MHIVSATPRPSAEIIPFPGARARQRVWTDAELAAMKIDPRQKVRFRRGLITIEGIVQTINIPGDGRGRVALRVTRGPHIGALTSVCALEVEVIS